MSKILYVIEQPLDDRNFDRFGIQAWRDRGWQVELWDLTPLTNPYAMDAFIASGRRPKNFDGYFLIREYDDVARRCGALGDTSHYIDFLGNTYLAMRVKLRLLRLGIVRTVFVSGSIPEPESDPRGTVAAKLTSAIAQGPAGVVKAVVNKVSHSLVTKLAPPGLVVVSGERSLRTATQRRRAVDIVQAHNLDYDLYLTLRHQPAASPRRPFAVFLDQDLCHHIDFAQAAIPYYVTPENYFLAVCRVLRRISAGLNVDVICAAHPRSSYRQLRRDDFDGIPIRYGDTAALIRDCTCVICHSSAAIQLAVLFGKPVVFVTTNELVPTHLGKHIRTFAAVLGKSVINLDDDLARVDWQKELVVNADKYAAYRREYIKTDGTPDLRSWDILARHVERARAAHAAFPRADRAVDGKVVSKPEPVSSGPREP